MLPSREDADSCYCVDIGAWDGKHLSNTYALLNSFEVSSSSRLSPFKRRWKALLIEADEDRFYDLKKLYKDKRDTVVCLHTLVEVTGQNSLGHILRKVN